MHCALSADLPRPRAKRDVKRKIPYGLWCTIRAHFEKIKALEIVENSAQKQRRSLCEIHRISDEISFVEITYLISYLNYSSEFYIRGWRFVCDRFPFVRTLLIGICCFFHFFSLMNLTIAETRNIIKISGFLKLFPRYSENWRNFKLFVFKERNFFSTNYKWKREIGEVNKKKRRKEVKNKLNKYRECKGKI